MRWLAMVALVLAVVVGASARGRMASPAVACSAGGVESDFLPRVVADSPIIAVGTIVDSVEERATLRVDRAIKGTSAGASIPVDNRTSFTYFDCGPPDAFNPDFDEGYRFKDGEQVLLFLHQEMAGAWHVSHFSFAAYAPPADDFIPLTERRDNETVTEPAPVRMDTILDEVKSLPVATNTGDAAERDAGCNAPSGLFEPSRLATYAELAQAVALVTVVEAPSTMESPRSWGPATVRVDRVLGGELRQGAFTLNQRWIGQNYGVEDCVAHVQTGGLGLVAGERYLVFLRPDELGGADYRAVSWGEGMVQVNDRYVLNRRITLEGIQRQVDAKVELPNAVPTVPLPVEQSPAATAEAPAKDAGRNWYIPVGLAVAALAVVVVTLTWTKRASRDT